MFDTFETYQYNEGRLRDALAVLKYGRSGEDRLNYSVHSDNAAQHFKSSKSLHWLSRQLFEMGFTSVLWDFGLPGHGKGDKHTHTLDISRDHPQTP